MEKNNCIWCLNGLNCIYDNVFLQYHEAIYFPVDKSCSYEYISFEMSILLLIFNVIH